MATFHRVLLLFGPLVSPSNLVKDPMSCQPANVSLPEGASKVIFADVSTYSKTPLLWKRNHVSSNWQEILLITDGQINSVDTAYKDYFYISGNDLAIQNASEVLTGCYKLTYGLKEICVQHVCIGILGSGAIHSSTSWTTVFFILVSVLLVLGLVCLGIYKYYKRRREGNRNEVVYHSTRLPDSENGAIHMECDVCKKVKWTDKLRRFFFPKKE